MDNLDSYTIHVSIYRMIFMQMKLGQTILSEDSTLSPNTLTSDTTDLVGCDLSNSPMLNIFPIYLYRKSLISPFSNCTCYSRFFPGVVETCFVKIINLRRKTYFTKKKKLHRFNLDFVLIRK